MVKSGLDFLILKFSNPLQKAELPGQFSHSGQIFLHWAAVTLNGLGEYETKKSRSLFTIISKKKMVISRLEILVHL